MIRYGILSASGGRAAVYRNLGIMFLTVFMAAFMTTGLSAQSDGQTDSISSFLPADESLPAERAETSARLAAWDPGEGTGLIAVRYVYPQGYHQINSADFFTVKAQPYPGIVFGGALKAEPVWEEGGAAYYDETTVLLEFRASPNVQPGTIQVEALFQICDEGGTCLFPDSQTHTVAFNPLIEGFGPDPVSQAVLDWTLNPQNAAGLPVGTEGLEKGTANSADPGSVLIYILMAFIGGILLNVMPCVLPLLSVKALNLVKQAGQSKSEILKHAWLYVGGIEVSFWILAGLITAIRASGTLLGWGFQFQSPAFVLILTAVIWVFSLSMFDIFVIQAPRKGLEGASKAGGKNGYIGSFLSGVFATLVATPCTAPFLGPALGFAFSQTPLVIFTIFSAVGLGLGLPFLILGLWPGAVSRLPKPGSWMNVFKQAMGFLLIATAVYLLTTLAKLVPASLDGALWWLLMLGFSAWLLGKTRNPRNAAWLRKAGPPAALLIAAGSGFLFVNFKTPPAVSAAAPDSYLESDSGVVFNEADITARIESGEPVFLEFTAAWCTTCKLNQRVIRNPEIRRLMAEKGVTHIIGDLTAYDETLTRWLADFGRAGVPLYVLYSPGRPPHIFPELIGTKELKTHLQLIDRL